MPWLRASWLFVGILICLQTPLEAGHHRRVRRQAAPNPTTTLPNVGAPATGFAADFQEERNLLDGSLAPPVVNRPSTVAPHDRDALSANIWKLLREINEDRKNKSQSSFDLSPSAIENALVTGQPLPQP